MTTFLRLLAKDLINRFNSDFRDVCIIFPNKRAGLFLAEEFTSLIDSAIWMPEIMTLGEYVESKTLMRSADNLLLIIKLYKAYIKASNSTESFDEFYYWGAMLLSDFDDLDKYLCDAKKLFSNIEALRDIEQQFAYLSEEQIELITRFWSYFNGDKFSPQQQEFLKVWEKLYDTYTDFKSLLIESDVCYEGMNERIFCENINKYDTPKHIVFVGFNALNLCEKTIFSYYRDNGVGLFYWDYDTYYTANASQEAGYYMRDNLKMFPNALGIEYFSNFLHNDKTIEYVSVSSSVGQTKLVAKFLEQLDDKENRETAVVLGDEQLLIPMLSSIPYNISKVNITMGYPAQATSVAALVSLICDLRTYMQERKGKHYFYYKNIIAFFNHTLIRDLCTDETKELLTKIHSKNLVYVDCKYLTFHPFLHKVFVDSIEHTSSEYLLLVLSDVLSNYSTSLTEIDKEFIFSIYTQIQIVDSIFKQEEIIVDNHLSLQIIKKVLSTITVPFSGEPLDGLQLMGLMETRMLDFKNLIILSANEGVLPKSSASSSFIPYSLRLGFGLPTPEHQDALFAYYFYRLLQRAKSIKLIYTSGTSGMRMSEMSRFLLQMKYESGLQIKESYLQNIIAPQENKKIEIIKNKEIMSILNTYTQEDGKKLSPSAMNTYITCPLKFYFNYVANIRERDELAEVLDPRLLGNIFHECSENLYKSLNKNDISEGDIDTILANDALIDEKIQGAYHRIYGVNVAEVLNSGANELTLHAVKKSLIAMFNYDKQFCPFTMLSMENKYSVQVEIKGGKATVYIGGFVDRIDEIDGSIRIIDYKTGSDVNEFKSIASVYDRNDIKRNKAAFQIMLYCLMYDNICPSDKPLVPAMYRAKSLNDKTYDCRLKCDKDVISNFRPYRNEYISELSSLLDSMYDSTTPFVQTENTEVCKNCSYKRICAR